MNAIAYKYNSIVGCTKDENKETYSSRGPVHKLKK